MKWPTYVLRYSQVGAFTDSRVALKEEWVVIHIHIKVLQVPVQVLHIFVTLRLNQTTTIQKWSGAKSIAVYWK